MPERQPMFIIMPRGPLLKGLNLEVAEIQIRRTDGRVETVTAEETENTLRIFESIVSEEEGE